MKKAKQLKAISEMMPYKETICLDEKQIPKLKTWKLGDTYEIAIKGKLVGLTQADGTVEGRFEVIETEEEDEGKDED